jgi:hypothetical protein
MKPYLLYPSFLVLIALLTAGCESSGIANRINEKSSLFTALEPDQKQYIAEGIVFPGDTTEMAYIALGNPTSIETKQSEGDTVEMWTYSKYYPSGQLAQFLTKYSQGRNPNLLRELNLETGKATVNSNAPGGPSLSVTEVSRGNDLSLPDLPIYNLYVFVYEGKIADVKIESIDKTTFMWLEEAIEMEKANLGQETSI